jgi:hypothetical protein
MELARRLEALGLPVGVVVGGWTAESFSRTPAGDAAIVSFVRGTARVDVRLTVAAADAHYFARVATIGLAHLPVAPELTRHAGDLMREIAARVSRRAAGVDLGAVLASSPPAPSPQPAPVPDADAYASETEAPPLDPARRTPAERPFMRFLTIDLADVARFPDAIRQMYDGTLGGLVIRNVYSPEFMDEVMARLAVRDADFPRTSFPARFKAHFYGRCLDGSDPLLDEYLQDAARFRDGLAPVFSGGAPFEARMEEMFRALAGGRAVQLPRFTDGRAYTPATIRILLEGGQIGTHCGNEAATRPAYTHLNTRIDPHDQISFFLTLQAPLGGGELIVYSLRWSDIDASRIVGGRTQVDDLLRDAEWLPVRTGPGDLLLFDGGRYFHRVSAVEGSRIRWTIGGFMMFSLGGETLYYWS